MRGTDYAVLAYYYIGLLTKGDAQLNFFADAAYLCRFEPQSHLAKRLSEHVELPVQQSAINHSFPADIDLASFLEKGNIQHLATLINKGTNPYTPICLMPGFRWNYYYLKLLHLHNTMLSAFADYFNPMLVLLGNEETDDKDVNDTNVLDEETLLIEKQQLVLLKDYEHSVAKAVSVSHSPNVYIVNQAGIIVQNELEKPIDYWQLFATLTQARVN